MCCTLDSLNVNRASISFASPAFRDVPRYFETMFNQFIHAVLLGAIAFSQILGGISCCCLSKVLSLAGTLVAKAECTGPASMLAEREWSRPACLRCLTSRQLTVRDQEMVTDVGIVLTSDQQCDCSQVLLRAVVPDEPRTVVSVKSLFAVPFEIRPARLAVQINQVARGELPVRFGGHSWRSIACVWKN